MLTQIRRFTPEWIRSKLRQRRWQLAQSTISQKFAAPYRVSIGCGQVRFNGWIHLDMDTQAHPDYVWDTRWGLPFESKTVELIANEHFLEHIPIEDANKLLEECHRVLKPGGTLRIAMPSLDHLLQTYGSADWRTQFEFLQWPHYSSIKTWGELANIVFRHFGHQWIYTREELHRRLHEAGFQTVRDVGWGSSEILELQNRETRTDSHLICEATKE